MLIREDLTNEEMALRIKAGENEFIPVLWGKCRKLIKYMAYKYKYVTERHAFVDKDDLMQCGYLALVEAVNVFDIEKGWKFKTYLNFAYKKELYRLFGNKRDNSKYKGQYIIPHAASSLNVTIENDDHETELLDMLEDEAAGRIEDAYEREEMRQIVEAAISKLDHKEQLVIYGRYYEELGQAQLVDRSNFYSIGQVARAENSAFTKLRRDPSLRALYYANVFVAKLPKYDIQIHHGHVFTMNVWDKWVNQRQNEVRRIEHELSKNARKRD